MVVEIVLGIIGIILIASIWFNIFLVKRLLSVSENLDEFLLTMQEFEEHLMNVYNMEKFYGDEVLNGLLEHCVETSQNIKDFVQRYQGDPTGGDKEKKAS
tara:strand:+ start:693 stop:992 length:300 start_codon:yes stop_codon:yes gene_type:complete